MCHYRGIVEKPGYVSPRTGRKYGSARSVNYDIMSECIIPDRCYSLAWFGEPIRKGFNVFLRLIFPEIIPYDHKRDHGYQGDDLLKFMYAYILRIKVYTRPEYKAQIIGSSDQYEKSLFKCHCGLSLVGNSI